MRILSLITSLLVANAFAVTACVQQPKGTAVSTSHTDMVIQNTSSQTPSSPHSSNVSTAQMPSLSVFVQWQAGSVVSEAQIKAYGLEKCFQQQAVSESVFARIKGKSYKAHCPLPLTDLRYVKVLHCNAEGKPQLGELLCHKNIATDLVDIFKNLYKAHYRIERMILIDAYGADDERSMSANNTTCFNFRYVAGTQRLSNHSKGCAIDINPLYNPYFRYTPDRRAVRPVGHRGRRGAARTPAFAAGRPAGDLHGRPAPLPRAQGARAQRCAHCHGAGGLSVRLRHRARLHARRAHGCARPPRRYAGDRTLCAAASGADAGLRGLGL